MKRFYFGQYWQVYGQNYVEVPSDFTIEQAIEYAKANWNTIGLANNATYVQDSDEPDFESCTFADSNTDSNTDSKDEKGGLV